MDIRYLIQVLLLIIFFIGIYYISLHRQTRQKNLLHAVLTEKSHFVYNRFSKLLTQKEVSVFEKYQIWRYIEQPR